MPLLPRFELPLPPNRPPSGYGWEERLLSEISSPTAFATGLAARDRVLGRACCVVCRTRYDLEDCHIIPHTEPETWEDLKDRNWIPRRSKDNPCHEPRNGIRMCPTHHGHFDHHRFFIRFLPQTRKFILVNYSGIKVLQEFHLKAIALDIEHQYAPFPSIFIIHEVRVRGYHPFQNTEANVPDDVQWQDWVTSDMLDSTDRLKRDAPTPAPASQPRHSTRSQTGTQSQHPTAGPSGTCRLVLSDDIISEILAATRALPTWKACEVEGTSWEGTAEENTRKYLSTIGAED